jgi:hypothetical protein
VVVSSRRRLGVLYASRHIVCISRQPFKGFFLTDRIRAKEGSQA